MEFDFTPQDSLETVPEQFRPLYTPEAGEDGKFSVNPDFAGVATAINGFNKTAKTLRQQLKGAAVDLSPLAEYGSTPEEIQQGIQAAMQTLKEGAKGKGEEVQKQIDSMKEALKAAHAKELGTKDTRIEGLQNQLYQLMVRNEANTAIAREEGIPDLLMPFVEQQIKVSEADGKFNVNVVDADGEIRYGATGGPMSVTELVQEMKTKDMYLPLFKSPGRSGGDTRPGGGSRPPAPRQQALSANDKIARGLSKRKR